jgi:hypothetical protein
LRSKNRHKPYSSKFIANAHSEITAFHSACNLRTNSIQGFSTSLSKYHLSISSLPNSAKIFFISCKQSSLVSLHILFNSSSQSSNFFCKSQISGLYTSGFSSTFFVASEYKVQTHLEKFSFGISH